MTAPDLETRIADRLSAIYGENAARTGLAGEVSALIEEWKPRIGPAESHWSENDALLITYADSLLGSSLPPLQTLHRFLEARIGNRITFLHLLPFYPATSDHGFSVSDFRTVRPDLGAWSDVTALGEDYRVTFDAVLNHVSSQSEYVRGYLKGDPRYESFCIARETIPDTAAVVRPRQSPLFHSFPLEKGGAVDLWTTFSQDQVDLDFRNPAVLLETLAVLLEYASRGASMIRLDAIPYLWKKPGTTCIHLPETHEIIRLIRTVFAAAAPHVILLSETNVPHEENISYFGGPERDEAQVIYNFTLPPLLLHTLASSDATRLSTWARSLEDFGEDVTFLNVTATHDGVGMRPTEGILTDDERDDLLTLALDHGGRVSYKNNADGSATPYELNINFFDAVNNPASGEDTGTEVARFLLSQSIPMVLRGIPGIYIHSLLGSRSDPSNVVPGATETYRSINREQLRTAALESELADPASRRARVLTGMLERLELRRALPALHPAAPQEILNTDPAFFALRRGPWKSQTLTALFNVTAQSRDFPALEAPQEDRLTGERFEAGAPVPMPPYQVRWLLPSNQ